MSQSAAQAAGLDLVGLSLQQALVKGRIESVEFYALKTVPEAAL